MRNVVAFNSFWWFWELKLFLEFLEGFFECAAVFFPRCFGAVSVDFCVFQAEFEEFVLFAFLWDVDCDFVAAELTEEFLEGFLFGYFLWD